MTVPPTTEVLLEQLRASYIDPRPGCDDGAEEFPADVTPCEPLLWEGDQA